MPEPATDAASFVDIDTGGWEVFPGIAAAPTPMLTMDWDKHRGVISGVRFQHTVQCGRCRRLTRLYTDGGTVTAGLEGHNARGRVRWFEVQRSNGYPSLPDTCPYPACGKSDRPFSYNGPGYLTITPAGPGAQDLVAVVWSGLRERFPDFAAVADAEARLGKGSRFERQPGPHGKGLR